MNAPDMRARLASAVHVLTALTRRVRPDGTLLESLDELALDGVLRSLTAVLAASRAHGLSVNVRGAGDVVRALDGLPELASSGAGAPAPGRVSPHVEAELDRQVALEETSRDGDRVMQKETLDILRDIVMATKVRCTYRGDGSTCNNPAIHEEVGTCIAACAAHPIEKKSVNRGVFVRDTFLAPAIRLLAASFDATATPAAQHTGKRGAQ